MAKKLIITKATDINKKEFDQLRGHYSVIAEGTDDMQVSDGYHTMDELYEHRIALFIALCKLIEEEDQKHAGPNRVWRSKLHADGSSYDGWFIMGINKEKGNQISYHLPIRAWELTNFADTFHNAPEWDGHTSDHVIHRIIKL